MSEGKHPGGRPRFFKEPEDLEKAITEYLEACEPKPMTTIGDDGEEVAVLDKYGNPVMIENPATVAGLAYHLGYSDRTSIYDLKLQGEKFSHLIKRAVLWIESKHEANLTLRDKPVGDIFWLKNHAGYKDRQEVQLETGPLEIRVSHDTEGI